MDYIEELCSFTNLGRKGGKDFLIEYYKKRNNPQNKLKVIHITGTAGKGSSSMMIANALEEAGFKVGLLTSPHLFKLNERIKINKEDISDSKLNNYIKYFFNQVPNATFSEYLTLIAVEYFLENDIDYFVCEVFVGGKYDPTNIFNSIATIITSIGLDHENLLGNTKEEILKNKLGILRKNIPLFTRIENKIIREEVKKIGAKLIKVEKLFETNLLGDFQKENAGIAYEVLKYLNIDESIINKSLKNVLWDGRIQFIEKNILIDSAHNPLGMKRLKEYLDSLNFENIYYLFAISKNKNFKEFVKYLKDAKEIVFTKPDIFKIEDPQVYANSENIIENPIEAYNYLRNKLDKNDLLVICGSIFLVSKILQSEKNLHLTYNKKNNK